MSLSACARVGFAMSLLLPGCTQTGEGDGVPRPDLRGAEPDIARAVEADQRAAVDQPDSVEAWARLGDRYRSNRWSTEASECYRRCEELDPQNATWPHLIGRSLMLVDPAGAARAFARALEKAPDSVPTLLLHGQLLTRLGRFAEAESRFGRALELEPGRAHASLGLGQLALGAGDFQSARRHLERALRVDPRMGEAHRALAQVLLALDDPGGAARHTALCAELAYRSEVIDPLARLRVEPAGSQARLDHGIKLMQRGRLDEAIERFEQALEIHPQNTSALVQLGRALFQSGRTDDAADAIRRALAIRPDSAATHEIMGRVLAVKGEPDQAAASWRRSLELNPDDAQVHYALGALLLDRGAWQDAEPHLTRAADLAPQDAEIRFYLGTQLGVHNRLEDSLVHLSEAVKLAPDNPDPRVNLGLTLSRLGRHLAAEAEFRRAIERDPEHVRAYNGLASALIAQQRIGEAITALGEARASALRAGDTGTARQIQQRLKLYESKRPYREE